MWLRPSTFRPMDEIRKAKGSASRLTDQQRSSVLLGAPPLVDLSNGRPLFSAGPALAARRAAGRTTRSGRRVQQRLLWSQLRRRQAGGQGRASGRCRLRSRRPGLESRDKRGRPGDSLSRRTQAPPAERRLAPFRPRAGRLGLGGRAGCVPVWPCSAARARCSGPPGRGPAQGLQDWLPSVDLTAPCSRLKR